METITIIKKRIKSTRAPLALLRQRTVPLILALFASILMLSCKKSNSSFSSDDCKMTKECLISFYEKLMRNQDDEVFVRTREYLDTIRHHHGLLTQGYTLSEIMTFIADARWFTDGEYCDTTVALSFPNGNILYYQVSDAFTLNHLWLGDGKELGSSWSYRRPACIKDSLGSVAIRKSQDSQSKVTATYSADELFYYTPNAKEQWLKVYADENSPCIGFVHRSQIKNFEEFSDELKKEIHDMLSGC